MNANAVSCQHVRPGPKDLVSTATITLFAGAAPFFAQAVADAVAPHGTDPGSLWGLAAQSGFNAVLVIVLLYFGRLELKEIRKEMKEQRLQGDRNTRLVTLTLLQLATLMPGVRAALTTIKEEVDEAEKAAKSEADR